MALNLVLKTSGSLAEWGSIPQPPATCLVTCPVTCLATSNGCFDQMQPLGVAINYCHIPLFIGVG